VSVATSHLCHEQTSPARYDLSDNASLVLVAPRSPTTRTGEHLKPMNRLSDSIIHCVHSKPNGYEKLCPF
jgi:hypothetical protein